MKLGIMQPYFLPYLGYWQLIKSVDKFVIYDDIQFTKKGWIQRNRFLQNGKEALFTLPIKKDSDYLDIKERFLADNIEQHKTKVIRQLEEAYKKAPNYSTVMPVIKRCFTSNENNLFTFLYNSIIEICLFLKIETPIIISSETEYDSALKGQDKVINLCKTLHASSYINSIGGVKLYSKQDFAQEGINLNFIKMNEVAYQQYQNEFIPGLSIIDVMMFNSQTEIQSLLNEYEII